MDHDRAQCVVVGMGAMSPAELDALGDQLGRTGLRIERAAQLRVTPELALVILDDATAPEAVDAMVAQLGGRDREVALFVAVDRSATSGGAAYLRAGADDVLWRPLDAEEVQLRFTMWRDKRLLARESDRLRSELLAERPSTGIVGNSAATREVLKLIERVARSDATVLVTGETGTGKELVSRAIHDASNRHDDPFVAVNLAAVPETLIESEIFGHEAGAFTGAQSSRAGRIEAAQGGTFFLDEVGDLPLSAQVKLLRVLQGGKYERLGGTKTREADFRLICATHRDLEAGVRDGTFREDLFYRLDVLRIHLPPLRERREDIELLAVHFLEIYGAREGRPGLRLGQGALDTLRAHNWPGNVRELQHTIERAVILCESGSVIGPELVQPRPPRTSVSRMAKAAITEGRSLDEVLLDMERVILSETLERFEGNQTAAARHLKLNRQTLRNRLRKCGLL